jgi:cytochrome c oxidase subunit II
MGEFFNSISKFFSSLFYSGSREAYDINNLFLQYMILAGVIILIVAGSIFIAAIIFRAKRKPGHPKQVFGNKKFEITWTVLPLLAVTFFFFLAVRTMSEINAPFNKKSQPDIIITAHQWWWQMNYPKYNVTTANELHIPVEKKLLMRIGSADVIHDWWVPELGRKIDAVPGRLNYTWIKADTAGIYTGTCSEYCGAEHAWMRIRVIAQDQKDFDSWIKNQEKVPKMPETEPAREGALLFQKKTCSNCHSIEGTPADASIGPDLTHVGSRSTLLSGMLKNNKANMTRWLRNPQKVKPGAHMPNFILSKNEINALVTYLEGLK